LLGNISSSTVDAPREFPQVWRWLEVLRFAISYGEYDAVPSVKHTQNYRKSPF
jgi:hypothetical protein